MGYAELEIGIHRWDERGNYSIDLRYSSSESLADVRPQIGPTVRIDFEALERLNPDPRAYGKALTDHLFGSPAVLRGFAEARASAQTAGLPLRLQLLFGSSAPELHTLRWETLLDPLDASAPPLLTRQDVWFSRYSMSPNYRPVHPLDRDTLRAVVAIADPADITGWQSGGRPLARIDVADEVRRAEAALEAGRPLGIEALLAPGGTPGADGNATLGYLLEHLNAGCEILYLVAHGAMRPDDFWLWLEDERGNTAVVTGDALIRRFEELGEKQPRLVVLVACQGAGTGEARAAEGVIPTAMGPRLAEAGVPAVLAMQGNVTMATMEAFVPAFFRELRKDGQVDRAVSWARGLVRDRDDSWMPVLFTRLKAGRLWYDRDVPGPTRAFDKWDALIGNIDARECTPIFGSGLSESILGTTREIARRWADTYRFPMARHQREDLPQVAQFLAETQDEPFPRRQLSNYLRRELRRQYGNILNAVPAWSTPDRLKEAALEKLISAVGARQRKDDPLNAYSILAALPFPVYITTNPDDLLTDALREKGREPLVGVFDWKSEVVLPEDPVRRRDPAEHKNDAHPLVYHLFGHLKQIHSLIMTEDDYFDYLINVSKNRALVPPIINAVLTNSSLLFLGFHLDDWDFRILFRSLMSKEGADFGKRNTRFAHVAVQIDPGEGRVIEPELARRYLERYFNAERISIYWGNVQDFLTTLMRRWAERD
jgi:hypothetical protein